MREEMRSELAERMQRAGGLPIFSKSLHRALDLIHTDASMPQIARAIEQDRKEGKTPVCVVGTLGTTSSTSVDPAAAMLRLVPPA